jgi:hypothetical protein
MGECKKLSGSWDICGFDRCGEQPLRQKAQDGWLFLGHDAAKRRTVSLIRHVTHHSSQAAEPSGSDSELTGSIALARSMTAVIGR